MPKVNVTELRQNLPSYLERVRRGDEIEVAVRGKVIARIIPEKNGADEAKARLVGLRKTAVLGDVLGPSGERWEAER